MVPACSSLIMASQLVRTVAVLALAGTLGVTRPVAAQYGPSPGSRPAPSRPSPTQSAPYGYVHRDPAFDRGFADGYDAGFDAARDRDRYDPRRERRYRSGDRGYERWYGPREYYRDVYRQGFLAGYERGYRDAARRVHGPRGRSGGWIDFRWRF
jgi:hypothetical protein